MKRWLGLSVVLGIFIFALAGDSGGIEKAAADKGKPPCTAGNRYIGDGR